MICRSPDTRLDDPSYRPRIVSSKRVGVRVRQGMERRQAALLRCQQRCCLLTPVLAASEADLQPASLMLLLIAAVLHATANALMKRAGDKLAFTW
jgi:hypothetical protein